MSASRWPTQINLSKDKRSLQIVFDDETEVMLAAELLRVESPSAEVQGHGADQKTTPAGKQHVGITAIEPVGNYAIRIIFDDGHETGIFSWELLFDYGQRQDALMDDYLARLDEENLTRT